MNGGIIAAIIGKDLAAFRADRFFMAMTLLGIVFYPVFFWVLPSSVDETIRLGVTPPSAEEALTQLGGESEGLAFVAYPDQATLATASAGCIWTCRASAITRSV